MAVYKSKPEAADDKCRKYFYCCDYNSDCLNYLLVFFASLVASLAILVVVPTRMTSISPDNVANRVFAMIIICTN